VTHRALGEGGPEPESGVVRVTHHDGSWQLKPIEGGTATWARFEAEIDLGGWLPMWLARAKSGDELPEVFREMSRLIVTHQLRSGLCQSICP